MPLVEAGVGRPDRICGLDGREPSAPLEIHSAARRQDCPGGTARAADRVMGDRVKELRVILVAWFLALVLSPGIYIFTGDIHEGGHALACIALGGNVKGLQVWLHDVLPFHNPPFTDCSLKPLPAVLWAAGVLASITAWSAGALIVGLLLKG